MIPTITPVPRTADGPRPQRTAECASVKGSAGAGQVNALRARTARGPVEEFHDDAHCLWDLDARDAALAQEQARYWRNFGVGTLIGGVLFLLSQCLFR